MFLVISRKTPRNNERSQVTASGTPIESSQNVFPTHFVADARFFIHVYSIIWRHSLPGVTLSLASLSPCVTLPWPRSPLASLSPGVTLPWCHSPSDPWIRSMDQNQIHGSELKAGQNRLPYLVLDWELSYVPLGHENVLRALCLSIICSHLTPLAKFGQC